MGSQMLNFRGHKFVGEEISWVGDCPWTGKPCFGTESGKLIIPGFEDGRPGIIGPISEEPINGAAFSGNFVGISTRENVVIGNCLTRAPGEFFGETFPGGAHGIVATRSGDFVAPLGRSGVLVATTAPDGSVTTNVATHPRQVMNFYRIVSLAEVGGVEYFACAARRGGIVVSRFQSSASDMPKGHASGQFDFIDVCSLKSGRWPLAAACLSADGAIFFGRDLLADRLGMLKLADIPGRAYSLLCVEDHLIMLTSECLIVLPDLASRFLNDGLRDLPIPMTFLSVNAVEVFSVGEEIFLVLEDEVQSISLRELLRVPDSSIGDAIPGGTNGHGTTHLARFDDRTPMLSGALLEDPSPIELMTYATTR